MMKIVRIIKRASTKNLCIGLVVLAIPYSIGIGYILTTIIENI
ncbi:MAG: hypothetical protein APG11_01762 [Candidatus Methanofastidiosum methylothiophilum]|uniref:Uncharacterized protein n=1 Tax=Candidatus Methanofastidiosum methylothiophilum TaxID=1705564 RepID=A0A150IP58_9EURY|nr:MAG: hypothetical protein APG11_01762 [Candidatus Methanofastidiosum methylthiophilus]